MYFHSRSDAASDDHPGRARIQDRGPSSRSFLHPALGYVDTYVMYRVL
jgi:hypothetical protein